MLSKQEAKKIHRSGKNVTRSGNHCQLEMGKNKNCKLVAGTVE